mmetsp:Transcript_1018/g.2514  ORF Transcript_1018/g.2514 Transcript_1018/m.2514 type:complete len:114 (-) Transcript_1018:1256-1597(-)
MSRSKSFHPTREFSLGSAAEANNCSHPTVKFRVQKLRVTRVTTASGDTAQLHQDSVFCLVRRSLQTMMSDKKRCEDCSPTYQELLSARISPYPLTSAMKMENHHEYGPPSSNT